MAGANAVVSVDIRANDRASPELARVGRSAKSLERSVQGVSRLPGEAIKGFANPNLARGLDKLVISTRTVGTEFRRAHSEMTRFAATASQSFGATRGIGFVGGILGGIAAAVGTTVAGLLSNLPSYARQQSNTIAFARTRGLDPRQFAATIGGLRVGGADSDVANTAVETLSEQLLRARAGMADPSFMSTLARLNVSPRDANGQMRTPQAVLEDVTRAMNERGMDDVRRGAVLRGLGLPDVLASTLRDPDALRRNYGKAFEDQRGTLDDEKAQSVNKALGELDVALEGLRGRVEYALVPAFVEFIGGLNTFIDKLPGWLKAFDEAAGRFQKQLDSAVPGLAPYNKGFGDWMQLAQKDPVAAIKQLDSLLGGSFSAPDASTLLDQLKKAFPSSAGAIDRAAGMHGDDPNRISYPRVPAPIYRGGGSRLTVDQIKAGLMQRGLSELDASAAAGNLYFESAGGNPNAVNPTSGARGLAQWLGSRRDLFRQQMGKSVEEANAQEQLDFVVWELNNSEKAAYDKVRSATTLAEKTDAFGRSYERAGKGELAGSMGRRIALAEIAAGSGSYQDLQAAAAADNRGVVDININSNAPATVRAQGPAIGRVTNRQFANAGGTNVPAPGQVHP